MRGAKENIRLAAAVRAADFHWRYWWYRLPPELFSEMMMARFSTPDRPHLDAASLDALASALSSYLKDGNDAASLQKALRSVAQQARDQRMQAEQLLLQLKDVWYELPAVKKMPEGAEQNQMLQRVVTLCIREYYSL